MVSDLRDRQVSGGEQPPGPLHAAVQQVLVRRLAGRAPELAREVHRAQPAGARPFGGMPVLLGCSERDPHIPIARVRETEAMMRALGAEVVTRIYPGGGHGINEDEVGIARRILARMVSAAPGAA